MLRRYNSTNLDTLVMKNRKTTIGSSPNCDVVVKGRGVSAIHASIESHSLGFWLKEHSLSGITKVNDQQVVGQIELQSGDLIQIGATNMPFVFESQWLMGSRPMSGKPDGHLPSILPSVKRITPTAKRKRSIENGSVRSSEASSTESATSRGSVGSNLLQRVIRLQAELINRDEKIRQLSTTPQPYHPLRSRLESLKPPSQPNFELCVYRGFLSAISAQLRGFNERVLKNPQREYSEVFTAMCRACDVPLATRIMEIEKHIEIVLIDSDFEENDELITKLNHFIRESRREKVLELTQELEVILPVIRDAASNARENAKVCAVFTQWSRQFGDIIRSEPHLTSEILLKAIEDLKRQFAEAHMSRHWLPPSIIPIFRLAALELEKSQTFYHESTIGHVESLQHELSYHIKNLESQKTSNDKLAKLVENLGNDYKKLMEIAGVSEESRKNSVLFVEITPEDIEAGRERDASATPTSKQQDYTEEVSIVNAKIAEIVGGDATIASQVSQASRKVQIDEQLLRQLLVNSMRLIDERGDRRRRSVGPMILVNEVDESKEENHIEEEVKNVPRKVRTFKVNLEGSKRPESAPQNSSKLSKLPRRRPKTGSLEEHLPESQNAIVNSEESSAEVIEKSPAENAPESSETSETSEIPAEESQVIQNHPEVAPNSEVKHPKTLENAPESSETSETSEIPAEESEVIQNDPHNSGVKRPKTAGKNSTNPVEQSDTSESSLESKTSEISAEESEAIQNDAEDAPESPAKVEEVASSTLSRTPPESPEMHLDLSDVPDNSIIDSASVKSPELDEQPMVVQGSSHFFSSPGFESHWKSHQNTANGRPNIVYQYSHHLPRQHTSPLPGKRSKSEDQRQYKTSRNIANRPPFVLY